jgi:hypothetical protein
MSEIDALTCNLNNLNFNSIEKKLIDAYIKYNNTYHNNFHNLISINNENDNEILLEINFLFQKYSLEVKNDLLKYNILNINDYTTEFLTCILAYVDSYFDPENYDYVYKEAIQKLEQNEDLNKLESIVNFINNS